MRTIVLTEEQIKAYTEARDIIRKPSLTVLWLDDMRDPNRYFGKKSSSGAFTRNSDFYNRLRAEYDVSFVWVRNMDEFVSYVEKNGVPEMVSFDHDLGKGLAKGEECAKWLKRYCMENGVSVPRYYVHSANNNGQRVIPAAIGGETQLNELVYVNGVEGKKANLTYDNSGAKVHRGNLTSTDMVKTDKMDQNNADTYEVPLKGGIMSYNITSIKGSEVMHYFKRYFEHQKTTLKLDVNGKKGEYELTMEREEFERFMERFKRKVWGVISHCISGYKGDGFKPNGICIYPVPSSSNFNRKMCEVLNGGSIGGLGVTVINENLFLKDLRNLEKDEDFIERNKKYYSGQLWKGEVDGETPEDNVDSLIVNRPKYKEIMRFVELANDFERDFTYYINKRLTPMLKSGLNVKDKSVSNIIDEIARCYMRYCDCIAWLKKNTPNRNQSDYIKPLKFAKPEATQNRVNKVWDYIWPLVGEKVCDVNGKKYGEKFNVQPLDPSDFQIKNSLNPTRMALKNIYNPNTDEEMVQSEVKKTLGKVFVIFDDNISGGATLSDICYQAKQLGIEHIIPITFGVMAEKNGFRGKTINLPTNDRGEHGFNLNEKKRV